MRNHHIICVLALAGCNLLKPRVSDEHIDAAVTPIDTLAIDAPAHLLPPGSTVPSITTSPELVNQIALYDGLDDFGLAGNNGVLARQTGKAGGATVMYWDFGPALVVDGFVASAPLYILADPDGAGGYTPRAGHPWLIDSLPGDVRYSAIRRLVYVPVTSKYAGEVIPSVEALQEATALGLVAEPVPAGTWRNMPVAAVGTKLEVTTGVAIDMTPVYGKGYELGLFPLGGTLGIQPLFYNTPPGGDVSMLLSGVASGIPPALPTDPDPEPVFLYGIPTAPPTTDFNYTPIVNELDVRLANGVDPSTINNDGQLFQRSFGSISGYYTGTVASFTNTGNATNKQIQFVDGAP